MNKLTITIFSIIFLLAYATVVSALVDVQTGYTHRYQMEDNANDTNNSLNLTTGSPAYGPTNLQGLFELENTASTSLLNTGDHDMTGGNAAISMVFFAKKDDVTDTNYFGGIGEAGPPFGNMMFLSNLNNSHVNFLGFGNDKFLFTGTRVSDAYYHYAVVYLSNRTIHFYLNGSLTDVQNTGADQTLVAGTITIGEDHTGSSNFVGDMDDWRFYDFALTAAQVLDIADNPNGSEPAADLFIENGTYNITSGINSGNQTVWRTNTSARAIINDFTPTVIVNTSTSGICAITDANENLTTALAGNGTLCSENSDNSTTIVHTCTIGFNMSSGNDSIFITCGQESSGYVDNGPASDSGAMDVRVDLYEIIGNILNELSVAVSGAFVYLQDITANTTAQVTSSNSSGTYRFEVETTGEYLVHAFDPTNLSQKPDAQLVNVTG